jgi:two-component system, NarL family, sensor histidine kinase DesK
VSGVADGPERALRVPRQPERLLVAVYVAAVAFCVVVTGSGAHGGPAYPEAVLLVLVGLGMVGVQLRHGLAAARGERPRAGAWTFLLLTVLVVGWMPWLGPVWLETAPAVLIASAMMVWPGRVGSAVALTVLVVAGLGGAAGHIAVPSVFYLLLRHVLELGLLAAVLYGAAWLVLVMDELRATRAELAELVAARRGLGEPDQVHAQFGQTLSAISFKSDLALRLLPRDTRAARHEIESLAALARDALRGFRAVGRSERVTSLPTQIDGAVGLLAAAGITTRVEAGLVDGLPGAVEEVFAMAVHEGVRNVLRHSQARMCSITTALRAGMLTLEIVNDGVRPAAGPGPGGRGPGLNRVARRAWELSGSLVAGATDGGRFRLLVHIPSKGGRR